MRRFTNLQLTNNLYESTNDSYKRDMNNNRTDNKNTNSVNGINKVNKNSDQHLSEKDQRKTKRLVVNEEKKVFVLEDSMVKHIHGLDTTKKLENKHKVYIKQFISSWIKSNLYE